MNSTALKLSFSLALLLTLLFGEFAHSGAKRGREDISSAAYGAQLRAVSHGQGGSTLSIFQKLFQPLTFREFRKAAVLFSTNRLSLQWSVLFILVGASFVFKDTGSSLPGSQRAPPFIS